MTGKTGRFIITPQLEEATPQLEEAVPSHDFTRAYREIGPSYVFMGSSLIPEADMQIAGREIKQVPPDFKSFMKPHKHEVSEVYVIIGDLTIEIVLDGEGQEVSGPASIFIPAGMMHAYRPLKGSGYVLVIDRSGEYKAFK